MTDAIDKLIAQELERAQVKYGKTFNSLHEGESVLREEIHEARQCLESCELWHGTLWNYIMARRDPYETVVALRKEALWGATEMIQVAAMCDKVLHSMKENAK